MLEYDRRRFIFKNMNDIEGLFRQIKKISEETLKLAQVASGIANERKTKAHRFLKDTQVGKVPT
jgi:hypothetical protein